MTAFRTEVDGRPVEAGDGWELTWIDRATGIAQLSRAGRVTLVTVDGTGTDWFVTIRGRRLPVTVRTRREQLLAEAEVAARAHGGPVEVRATLPGLVVAVKVEAGAEVGEGDPLLTIEAMKMQNEVRAPRPGRVAEVHVSAGQPVATGAPLLRLE